MILSQSSSCKLKPPARLSEQVVDLLMEEIKNGTYRPGDRLPSESHLAAAFGVSRTVIREALARLKYDGYLETRQGLGATVAESRDRLVFRIDHLEDVTDARLGALFELRAMLESEAASLAAKRRSQEQLEAMGSRLKQMEESIRRHDADGAEADHEFHRLIAASCHNAYLLELMEFLNSKVEAVIRTARAHSSRYPGWPVSVQQEHVSIFEAISAGDAKAARKAMLEHITKASQRLGLSIFE